jgi:hypothetical protein
MHMGKTFELCTKYTGCMPHGKQAGAVATFKTGVNSRLPLSARVEPLHSAREDAESLDAHKQPAELAAKLQSIKPTAQDVALQRRHPDGGSIQQTSVVSTIKSSADAPPRAKMHVAEGDGQIQNIPMTQCRTIFSTSTDSFVHNRDMGFLSRVRKIEKDDDDARAAEVQARARADEKTNLRSAAVVHKRETDPRMAPPPMQFDRVPRAVPNAVKANASDSVRFTHAPVPSHSQLEFADPRQRLEECRAAVLSRADAGILKNELALGSVSGSVDLQAGTAKDFDHIVSSGYGGHCPAHPRNISAVQGPAKEVLRTWSKSPLGLVSAAHKKKSASIYSLLPQLSEEKTEAARASMQASIRAAPKVTSASLRHTMAVRGF